MQPLVAPPLSHPIRLAVLLAFLGVACESEQTNTCNPACEPGERCESGSCARSASSCPDGCAAQQHCEEEACVANVCQPACAQGERCLSDGADACACGDGPRCTAPERCVGGACRGPCEDGEDNDGDGWTDTADPDCAVGATELGTSTASCNDGLDNDEDGLTDAADAQCQSAASDEVVGAGPCVDTCVFMESAMDGASCELYDATAGSWAELDAAGRLHDRSRAYDGWLRRFMLPEGGVADAEFTDTQYREVAVYDATGDSAIWTGTYLAAEALRARVTGAPDARSQCAVLIRTLHTWFTISGDPGYLARYALPAAGDPRALAAFSLTDRATHLVTGPDGKPWYWRGHNSRDQYQGPLLGYSLAYEVLAGDEPARELIRQDVVTMVEQLMLDRTVSATITIDSVPIDMDLDLTHAILTDDETSESQIELTVDSANPSLGSMWGFQEFMPDVAPLLRQIPLLSWLPALPRPGSAIMLASFFQVALQVTEGVPAYAARREVIESYYLAHADEWLDVAELWTSTVRCGAAYYGLHIDFLPTYNLGRLETDPGRSSRVRDNVLHSRMWPAVSDHKNVLFAFIEGALSPATDEVPGIVRPHVTQLEGFAPPPRARLGRDLTGRYPEDGSCPGLSSIAIDVSERVIDDYIWQRKPWELTDGDHPTEVFPGVDYLIAYWLGRAHGFIAEDSSGRCLRWRGPE